FVSVGPEPLDLRQLVDFVREGSAGAIATFSGTTRDTFTVDGTTKKVLRLDYESYTPMAILHLHRLMTTSRTQHPSLSKIAIAHRTGTVPVGEESVIIAASSPHRRDALEAVGWMIDELKRTVPIWKKEVYEDGSVWKGN
ncbi:Molybdopterin biosynthesis MoaE, partial [Blyttiomyces helicus]